MNPYLVIPLTEAAFCLMLIIIIIIKGLRHVAIKPFIFFLTCMGLWGFFIFLMRLTPSLTMAFFWEYFVFFSIVSASMFFYRFALSFTGSKQTRRVFYAQTFFYVLVMALVPTGLVVSGMQMMWYGKAPIIGPAFILYVLCIYAFLGMGLVVLLKYYRHSKVINERVRASYIIAGIVIMFIGGTTDYLPAVGVNIYPMGIVGNLLFCLMASVAMLRYGLLEFQMVVRRGTTIALIGMLIAAIIAITLLIFNIFAEVSVTTVLIVTAITILAVSPAAQPIASRLQRLVDRLFYGQRYEHLQALTNFFRETKDIANLGELSSSLLSMIAKGTQAGSVYLQLPDSQTGGFTTYLRHGQGGPENISLPASSLIIQTMKYQDGIIDINDIDVIPSLRAISGADMRKLVENKIELLLPLKAKERLTGMLFLGGKISGKTYSAEDRRLLETVSHQAAIAIENSRLYEELKQQLISSSKLASLGELAAYVAHEVNNGLQCVLNFGAILQDGTSTDGSNLRKEDLQTIESEALRAKNIVGTLFDITRQERVGKEAVDINDMLRSVATLARLRVKTEAISFIEKYSEEPLFVHGSAEQLRQVFLNLFVNATDAMPDGGKIEVKSAGKDDHVIITVSDTGVGIPSHLLDKIFEPLFTTKSSGTGLGLTVSRSIIRDHGGTIDLESEENVGTTFTITLPRIKQKEE